MFERLWLLAAATVVYVYSQEYTTSDCSSACSESNLYRPIILPGSQRFVKDDNCPITQTRCTLVFNLEDNFGFHFILSKIQLGQSLGKGEYLYLEIQGENHTINQQQMEQDRMVFSVLPGNGRIVLSNLTRIRSFTFESVPLLMSSFYINLVLEYSISLVKSITEPESATALALLIAMVVICIIVVFLLILSSYLCNIMFCSHPSGRSPAQSQDSIHHQSYFHDPPPYYNPSRQPLLNATAPTLPPPLSSSYA